MEMMKGIELNDVFEDMFRKNHSYVRRERKANLIIKAKEIIIGVVAVICLLSSVWITQNLTDIREAKIVEIYSGGICFETKDGNLWDYETEKKYKLGDTVKVSFFDYEDFDVANDKINFIIKK